MTSKLMTLLLPGNCFRLSLKVLFHNLTIRSKGFFANVCDWLKYIIYLLNICKRWETDLHILFVNSFKINFVLNLVLLLEWFPSQRHRRNIECHSDDTFVLKAFWFPSTLTRTEINTWLIWQLLRLKVLKHTQASVNEPKIPFFS